MFERSSPKLDSSEFCTGYFQGLCSKNKEKVSQTSLLIYFNLPLILGPKSTMGFTIWHTKPGPKLMVTLVGINDGKRNVTYNMTRVLEISIRLLVAFVRLESKRLRSRREVTIVKEIRRRKENLRNTRLRNEQFRTYIFLLNTRIPKGCIY